MFNYNILSNDIIFFSSQQTWQHYLIIPQVDNHVSLSKILLSSKNKHSFCISLYKMLLFSLHHRPCNTRTKSTFRQSRHNVAERREGKYGHPTWEGSLSRPGHNLRKRGVGTLDSSVICIFCCVHFVILLELGNSEVEVVCKEKTIFKSLDLKLINNTLLSFIMSESK